jgi:hypothetical protein
VRTIGKGEATIERRLSVASVNRPLALLRCLLRLARDEWEVITKAPRMKLDREPRRMRWLKPEEPSGCSMPAASREEHRPREPR